MILNDVVIISEVVSQISVFQHPSKGLYYIILQKEIE